MLNIFNIQLISNPFNKLFLGKVWFEDREAGLSSTYRQHYRSFDEYNARIVPANEVLLENGLYLKKLDSQTHADNMKDTLKAIKNNSAVTDSGLFEGIVERMYTINE